jgi:DNA topoisomerase I
LAIPPAWTDVWVCPFANGHIQAVGQDAKGRRQYLYHPAWRLHRDREKFDRMLAFGRRLPSLRADVDRHLELDGLPRDKVLSAAVYLLDVGLFRIGGEVYAEDNGSYGLASLRREHVQVQGESVVFEYPAKSGKERIQSVTDPRIRAVVSSLKRRRGGECLLAYRDGRQWSDVRSDEINEHLRRLVGPEVTAKDFRTWHATVLAAIALAVSWKAESTSAGQSRAVSRAVREVAEYLGNTPAVCRASYIDPQVIDLYRAGVTIRRRLGDIGQPGDGLASHGAAEKAVVELLRRHGG